MKIKYLLIAVLAGAALVGCNKDGSKNNPAEEGVLGYVSINVFSTTQGAGTKAENPLNPNDFENGDSAAKENDVDNARFIFFRNGANVTTAVAGDFDSDSGSDTWNPTGTASSDRAVEKVISKTIILKSAGAKPNQVLTFINLPDDDWEKIKDKGLDEVVKYMNSTVAGDAAHIKYIDNAGDGNFIITNSPYFNPIDGSIVYAYPIDPDINICEKASDALNAPLDIYVERLACKLDVTYKDTDVKGKKVILHKKADGTYEEVATATAGDLEIDFYGWHVNGVNREAYITKNMEAAWWNGGSPLAWMALKETATDGMKHRTSWEADPNFTSSKTPYTSYPNSAYELAGDFTTQHLWYFSGTGVFDRNDLALKNGGTAISKTTGWSEIKGKDFTVEDKGSEYVKTTKDYRERHYMLPNTMDKTLVPNFRRVGTHALVLAKFSINGSTEQDFYKYNGTVYAGPDEFKTIAINNTIGMQSAKRFAKIKDTGSALEIGSLGIDDVEIGKAVQDKNTLVITSVERNIGAVTIPTTSTRASDGWVSIFPTADARALKWYVLAPGKAISDWPDDAAITALRTQYNIDNPSTPIADNYTYAKTILLPEYFIADLNVDPSMDAATDAGRAKSEFLKAFEHNMIDITNGYESGLMYYCVPIEHLAHATPDKKNPVEGDYGVVRNHFYKINVTGVSNLGKGIYDPSERIVPGDDVEEWYIAARLHINSWKIVKQQNVVLGD